MLFSILFFLVMLNTIVAVSKKRSEWLLFITIGFIIVVFVGSRQIADLHNYTYDFEHGFENMWSGGQFLFRYFTVYCHNIGMSFDTYRFILSLIGLICYYKFVNKFSPLPNMVFVSYLCYLFIMDDVQIRNFIGCAIFCLGLIPLYRHNEHWRRYYIFWIVVASTIHSSFWVYLIFLLVPKDIYRYNFIKVIGISAISFSIVALFVREYLNSVVLLFSFIDDDKTSHYLLETTNFGGALFLIIQIFAICSIFYIKRQINKYMPKSTQTKDNVLDFLQLTILIDILALLLVPAAIFSITFYRLLRNIFFTNAISFSLGYYYMKNYRIITLLMLICYTGLYYYYDLTGDIYIEEIIVPFFNKNIYL